LEAGHPEHYWQYEIQPSAGAVRVVQEVTSADYTHQEMLRTFQAPAGAISTQAALNSGQHTCLLAGFAIDEKGGCFRLY
jgi:hypothetical protein